MATAKKGDLVALEIVTRPMFVGSAHKEYRHWELGVVTSATRDGLVKTAKTGPYRSTTTVHDMNHAQPRRGHGIATVVVQSAKTVDVAGLCESGVIADAFDSLEAVKAAVGPYKLATV